MATTKVKVVYGAVESNEGSKTYGNLSPEASNESLAQAIGQFNGLQTKPVKELQRIDTTVISG